MTRREQVLNYVNRLRGELGLKPISKLPKAVPTEACHCVIADALSTKAKVGYVDAFVADVYRASDMETETVDGVTYYSYPKCGAEPLLKRTHPKYVRDFIRAFDTGKFPDLIKPGFENYTGME